MLSQWEIPLHHHVERLRWAVPRAQSSVIVALCYDMLPNGIQSDAKVHVIIEDPEPVTALVKGCPY